MNAKMFVAVTGAIFSIVALVHLLRIYFGWPLLIGNWDIPMWISWVAVVVAGGLGYCGFRLATRK
jgi:hypothetical protein